MNGIRTFRCVLVSVIVLTVHTGTAACAYSQAIYSVAIDPVTPTTVFAGGSSGTLKSTDGGATWSLIDLTRETSFLVLDPVTQGTVYAGSYSGISKSTDGGANWSTVGPPNLGIYSLAIDSKIPTTLYAGTDTGVVKSTDGGANWSLVGPTNLPVYSVVVDSVTPTTIYAGSAGAEWAEGVRVFKSTDGGASWSLTGLTSAAWQIHSVSLAIDPVMTTAVYAAYSGWGCDNDGCFTLGAISKSIDGAASWSEIDGLVYWGSWVSPQPWPSALAIDPVTPATLYAAWRVRCDQFDSYCQEGKWIKKSADGGASWFHTADLSAYALAVDPLTPTTVYAGTEAGVVKSTDGGDTWGVTGTPQPSDTATPDTSIISAAEGSGTVLADGGITLSTSMVLTFTGADNVGLARFECRRDGAAFSVCNSPLTYNGLALGRHTFEVRAVDTSSNVDPMPARYTWNVDAAPETALTHAVDGRGKSIANGGSTPSDRMPFRFTGTDNGAIAGFECRLDAGNFIPCISSVTYTGVRLGTHTFQVRAIDGMGFRDPTAAVFTWRR